MYRATPGIDESRLTGGLSSLAGHLNVNLGTNYANLDPRYKFHGYERELYAPAVCRVQSLPSRRNAPIVRSQEFSPRRRRPVPFPSLPSRSTTTTTTMTRLTGGLCFVFHLTTRLPARERARLYNNIRTNPRIIFIIDFRPPACASVPGRLLPSRAPRATQR